MRHRHADKMGLYAQDAAETDKPWERWESKNGSDFGPSDWSQCTRDIMWDCEGMLYRRKPKLVKRTISYPKPMREAPEIKSQMWVVFIESLNLVQLKTWFGTESCYRYLERGLCHTTPAAAIAHAKALLGESDE